MLQLHLIMLLFLQSLLICAAVVAAPPSPGLQSGASTSGTQATLERRIREEKADLLFKLSIKLLEQRREQELRRAKDTDDDKLLAQIFGDAFVAFWPPKDSDLIHRTRREELLAKTHLVCSPLLIVLEKLLSLWNVPESAPQKLCSQKCGMLYQEVYRDFQMIDMKLRSCYYHEYREATVVGRDLKILADDQSDKPTSFCASTTTLTRDSHSCVSSRIQTCLCTAGMAFLAVFNDTQPALSEEDTGIEIDYGLCQTAELKPNPEQLTMNWQYVRTERWPEEFFRCKDRLTSFAVHYEEVQEYLENLER